MMEIKVGSIVKRVAKSWGGVIKDKLYLVHDISDYGDLMLTDIRTLKPIDTMTYDREYFSLVSIDDVDINYSQLPLMFRVKQELDL